MKKTRQAVLVLEDGSCFNGEAFGDSTDAVFELVFNTSQSGYQEICTDPSYKGQGVLFTVPHIGNVGINPEDHEAESPQVSAVVTRKISQIYSSWRAVQDLPSWLKEHGVPGIAEVDTRAITRKLRQRGTMKAAISTQGTEMQTLLEQVQKWPGLDGLDMVMQVTCTKPFQWNGDKGDRWVPPSQEIQTYNVVLFDFGAKRNIMRHLAARGASVTVVPAHTCADKVLALQPDGVMLSNGPGDPAGLPYAASAAAQLIESGIPVFGICLGHQLIAHALGAHTQRLKFGHHSGNHPVQDVNTKQVYVTAQNHNYTVVPETIDPDKAEITHLSLNDGSVEGLRLKNRPVYSVQFHPEAAPGPHDAHDLFGPFFKSMCKES